MHFEGRGFFVVLIAAGALSACAGSGVTGSSGGGVIPGATSSPAPISSPLSAYCSTMNYSPASGGIRVDITDDSAIGAVLIVYVQNGTSSWLATNGTFAAGTPNPLPAGCFTTTLGSKGTVPLVIPTGVGGGRIYLALATPNPNPSVIPNPFGDVNAQAGGPNVGYQAAPFPWDKIEYGSVLANKPVIDTTQVDMLGLPLELTVSADPLATPMPDNTAGACVANTVTAGSSGPYGVTSCKFAQIFTTIEANAQYSSLAYTALFNGKLLDTQVVSPAQAGHTSFDWTYLNNYLQQVLASYQSTPRLFTNLVSGAQNPQPGTTPTPANYCASSDGSSLSSNFLFTNIGTGTTCPGTPKAGVSPNPFKLPAALFAYANVPKTDGSGNVCMGNLLFSQPFGLAYVNGVLNNPTNPNGQLFASNDAFAMWKGLTADLNYGTALNTTQTHPVGQVSPPPITPGGLFQDASYNQYDKLLHDNFNGGLAYGIPYDDLYTLESGVAMSPSGGSIVLRVNAIPLASLVMPGSLPSPLSVPSPCPVVSPGVGSY